MNVVKNLSLPSITNPTPPESTEHRNEKSCELLYPNTEVRKLRFARQAMHVHVTIHVLTQPKVRFGDVTDLTHSTTQIIQMC